jgi:hypothetical protein
MKVSHALDIEQLVQILKALETSLRAFIKALEGLR